MDPPYSCRESLDSPTLLASEMPESAARSTRMQWLSQTRRHRSSLLWHARMSLMSLSVPAREPTLMRPTAQKAGWL
eukprot:6719771-Prymnesium_polylepis.1